MSNGTIIETRPEEVQTPTEVVPSTPVAAIDIKLYPNPVADVLNVNLAGLTGQRGQLSLNNQMGQQVKTLTIDNIAEGPIQLQTDELGGGTYFLTIVADGNFIATKKVMKVIR